jgi:D-xylose transport system substrate-binding protein
VAFPFTRTAAVAAVALFAGVGLSACGANDDTSDGGDGGTAKTIALLLPESETTRYEAYDRPLFEAKVKELCADCTIDYYNADKDEAKQAQQVDTAINKGATVIVLDPVNGAGAGGMVQAAQAGGAKVIAYDRFIAEADYYTSFDNATVGKFQAQALDDAMGDKGKIIMLNGAPSDPNAAQFKAGAHGVIDGSGLDVIAEYDNPDWSAENAQKYTNDQINKFGAENIQGVYAANDQQAGGAIAALTGAGVKADALPPVTGQDAETAALQRIIAGEQTMTIYKPYSPEAEGAAALAVKLANGETPSDTTDFEGVPSYILDPVVLTKDNIATTIVADGLVTVADICTGEYAAACTAAGLQ